MSKGKHTYTVTVSGCTKEQADQVMAERLSHDEDYGFDYSLSPAYPWQEPEEEEEEGTQAIDILAGEELT